MPRSDVLLVDRKERLLHLRPWLLGIPSFMVVSLFLVWVVARLASWVFVVLRVNK